MEYRATDICRLLSGISVLSGKSLRQMVLNRIDHGLEVLKFGVEGDGASRAQDETRPAFADMVDQLLTVGGHLFRRFALDRIPFFL